jgi:hypothetical protein
VNLAIERNFSAMRQVESLAEEASMLKENEEKDGQPIGRLQYKLRPRSLQSNHIGAIARLYGEYGDEVIRHLLKTPLTVLPIVFKRLREKDAEWRKVRTELTQKHWRSATIMNYEGSLDVLCVFYRRELERSSAFDGLLDVCILFYYIFPLTSLTKPFSKQCNRAKFYHRNPQKQRRHPAIDPFTPRIISCHDDHRFMIFQPTLSVKVTKNSPHRDVFDLLYFMCQLQKDNNDVTVSILLSSLTNFLIPFFGLSPGSFLHYLTHNSPISYSSAQRKKCTYRYNRYIL